MTVLNFGTPKMIATCPQLFDSVQLCRRQSTLAGKWINKNCSTQGIMECSICLASFSSETVDARTALVHCFHL